MCKGLGDIASCFNQPYTFLFLMQIRILNQKIIHTMDRTPDILFSLNLLSPTLTIMCQSERFWGPVNHEQTLEEFGIGNRSLIYIPCLDSKQQLGEEKSLNSSNTPTLTLYCFQYKSEWISRIIWRPKICRHCSA